MVINASACLNLLSFPWLSTSETVTLYLCLKELHSSSHFLTRIGYLGMVAVCIYSMEARKLKAFGIREVEIAHLGFHKVKV